MRFITLIVFLTCGTTATAQSNLNIVPMPVNIVTGKGVFNINKETTIIAAGYAEKSGALLNDLFFENYGLKLNTTTKSDKDNNANSITFLIDGLKFGAGSGVYALEITGSRIIIGAGTEEGLFYGMQTLFQLMTGSTDAFTVPQLKISDHPRFSYRGMHLDVGRHFFPVTFIKKYLDYLAAYKYNVFHWHLTEDQGWRIEIKKYPELTNTGAWRNGTLVGRYPGKGNDNTRYGGFYTQEEIKEVVQYAAARYIEVIPEIEMPGHSSAAIAAYSWLSCFPEKPTEIPAKMISQRSIDEQKKGRIKLVQETWGVFDDVFCAGKESTFGFLENVIDEVTSLFPSTYFHIGADECPKTHWKICTACQQRMRENNLKDEHELQSWFVQRIEKYLNSKSKILIGWDEILEGGLAPNAVVMSWRGEKGGIEAARQKHKVIMTPGNPVYFDHTQSKNEDSVTIGGYNPIEKVYTYEPIPKELTAKEGVYVLGAQANMWTEYMQNTSKVEYMMFPRMIALSEVLWSPKEKRNWTDFERRLPVFFERMERKKINFSKAYYDLKASVLPTEDYHGVIWKVESNNRNGRIKRIPSFFSSMMVDYVEPIRIIDNVDRMSIVLVDDNNKWLSSVVQSFYFNKATGKKITILTEPSKSYPGNGAFTLVDGVQNEKGMSKTSEFLGFSGTDLDAIIDLGKEMNVSTVTVHVLKQPGSWIYLPGQVEVSYLPYIDTTIITRHPPIESITVNVDPDEDINKIEIKKEKYCRYIQVRAKNYGTIPSGKPGAGNPSWLFVDEIEIN